MEISEEVPGRFSLLGMNNGMIIQILKHPNPPKRESEFSFLIGSQTALMRNCQEEERNVGGIESCLP